MHFQYNPYIWFYLGGAAVLFLGTVYAAAKRTVHWLWVLTQAMVCFWCLGMGLQISGTSLKTAVFWHLVANDFVGCKVPVVWLLWALVITGKNSWLTRRRVMSFFALPLVTDFLNLTNSRHGLMYREWNLNTSGPYPLLEYACGPWYWVLTVYCGIILSAVIVRHIKAALNREVLHRKQGLVIAGATLAVLITIALCYIKESIFPYDLIPVSVSIAAISSCLLSRFRRQEKVPVPRNAVLEKMTDAVFILDTRNRIMDLNPAAEKLFGLKASEVAGSVLGDVLNGWTELAAAVEDKYEGSREICQDGRYYEAHFSDLNDEQKIVGRLVVIQDVTAAKMAEAKLVEQQQALLVLQERERLARELHDSLGQVFSYTQMQIQNIQKLLTMGELKAADNSLARLSQVILEANTEVREFIYEVKATLLFKEGFFATLQQHLSRFGRNFKIATEVRNPDGLTEDEIDLTAGVQLFRIIQEALTNVRKHAKASKVTITFRKEKRHIRILVVDDGIGFDPQKLPGRRLSFGLEVMQERAAQVGGDVQIYSRPGRGTTVSIQLPYYTKEQSKLAAEVNTGKDKGEAGIRVLLVDDHALFIEGLRNLLSSRGFDVVGTAKDGLEALVKARLLRPELILMDLQMPRCNGLTATRLIKAEMPEIKIVILTMSDQEQDLLEAFKNGASGYLLKGLRADDMFRQLTELVSGSAALSPQLAAQVLEEFHQHKGKEGEEQAAPTANPVEPEKVLSPRQIEILKLVTQGKTYKEIAAQLYISERTVKYEMAAIIKQLHLKNRAQAVAYAREMGLGLEPDSGHEQ